ncbi:MAG: 4Fe-4S dicluster domain-containing protein [Thermodesulfobacteriota bacterium]
MGKKTIVAKDENCTGCRLCQLACSSVKEGEFIPDRARIKIVHDGLGGWSRPVTCFQCEDPMCLAVCPAEAISKGTSATGEYAVLVDKEKCIGCQRCVAACPFGAMEFFKDSLATKCDLCGGSPKCVEFCFYDCLHFVELSQKEEGKRKGKIKALYAMACKEIGRRELFGRRRAISSE